MTQSKSLCPVGLSLALRERVHGLGAAARGPLRARAGGARSAPAPRARGRARPAARAARSRIRADEASAGTRPQCGGQAQGVSPAACVRRQPQGVGGARAKRLLQRHRPVLLRAGNPLPGLRAADAHHRHRPRARGEDPRGAGFGRRRALAARARQVDGERRRAVARVLEAHAARARDQPRHQHRPAQLPARASQLRRHVHGGHRLALPRRRAREAASAGLRAGRPAGEFRPGRGDRCPQLRLHDPGRQRRPRVDAGAGVRRWAAHLRPVSLRHGAARGARAVRPSRRRDAAGQLPRQERHVRDRPAHRRRRAARRAEGPGDRAHRARGAAGAAPARPVHSGKS